jgi:hypothetical protein
VIEIEDKYFDWLKERRKLIIEKVQDTFFKDIMLKIHNEYAEQYVCLRGEK